MGLHRPGILALVEALRAAVWKEWRQEARSLSGLAVTASFAFIGGVLGGLALYGIDPDPQLLAALIWLILLFAGAVTLPPFSFLRLTGEENILPT